MGYNLGSGGHDKSLTFSCASFICTDQVDLILGRIELLYTLDNLGWGGVWLALRVPTPLFVFLQTERTNQFYIRVSV